MSIKNKKVIQNIIDNYIRNEKNIVNQLYFTTGHGPTIGGFREDIWREMFQQIIPGKFVIEQSVFIIDSKGKVSKEVDLAIFDETYTPYIFRYGRLKFLPIEAVAVVVECKSSSLNMENLKKWGKSITELQTSNKSYARIATCVAIGKKIREQATQTATRPLRILCKLNENIVNEKLESGAPLFDIEIVALEKEGQLKVTYREGKEKLQEWYRELNHVNLAEKDKNMICNGEALEGVSLKDYLVNKQDKEVSLLSLNLQLNQLLMLINNPILFPHIAYAEMFNKAGGQETDE